MCEPMLAISTLFMTVHSTPIVIWMDPHTYETQDLYLVTLPLPGNTFITTFCILKFDFYSQTEFFIFCVWPKRQFTGKWRKVGSNS